ncbi:substrate-binding periplasmic protein [Colwellia hornerae]|uniref:Amino acid ABC transporter substrate-binding protein n=1 Tax=Colwellia hornerae TaxID=89402 RepID=A0A5C6QKI5_9GAMM|nr:transporter substrate-binding domain-containing protein [Colwellia hornerae]TWX58559.1 amino acid ABC transporter substrate-binding protein [Colwellia hornerae]TWX59625.1 amino acid ABC transporter substrate-binding protein [Colwellia hornerae]TWX69351.1 amino acid ABC transporter substrate-binding protein [Colwellia hornerae]
MTINRKINLCFFNILLITSWSVIANTYKVVSYDPANPPHNISTIDQQGNTKISGIFADMFLQIGEITGDTFIMVKMPAARAMLEFDLGRVDIEPGINPVWRSNSKEIGLYSIAYERVEEVIVFRAGDQFDVKTPKDLFGHKVGIVRGFIYPRFESSFAKDEINRILNKSESLLIKQLLAERIDQIFISKSSIEYMKRHLPALNDIVVGDVVSSVEVMMRVHPTKLELIPRLNKALQQMINDKSIEKIIAKYQ